MQQLDDQALKYQLQSLRKGFCQSLHLRLVLNYQEMNQNYHLFDQVTDKDSKVLEQNFRTIWSSNRILSLK